MEYLSQTKEAHINFAIIIERQKIALIIEELKKIPNLINLKSINLFWKSENKIENLRRITNILKSDSNLTCLQEKELSILTFVIPSKDQNYLKSYNGRIITTSIDLLKIDKIIEKKLTNYNYLKTFDFEEYNAILNLTLGYDGFKNYQTSKLTNLDISKDLEGSNEWSSLSEMFKFLNATCEWIVLRNFEDLSDNYEFGKGDDIDILCSDLSKFTSLMNAKKREGGRCSYYVWIANKKVILDIRFVGDKYYDPLWCKDMLEHKQYKGLIPVMSDKDYFFSLLYHVKLQKKFIKEIYVSRLNNLKSKINLLDIKEDFVYDDSVCSGLLNSFLRVNSYSYTFTDDAVRNEFFLKKIKHVEIIDFMVNWRVLLVNTFKIIFKKSFNKLTMNLFKNQF